MQLTSTLVQAPGAGENSYRLSSSGRWLELAADHQELGRLSNRMGRIVLDTQCIAAAGSVMQPDVFGSGSRIIRLAGLSALCEAVVFHDCVVGVSSSAVPSQERYHRSLSDASRDNPVLRPLIEAGVLNIIDTDESDVYSAVWDDFEALQALTEANPVRGFDPVLTSRALFELRSAEQAGLPYTVGPYRDSEVATRYAEMSSRAVNTLLRDSYAALDGDIRSSATAAARVTGRTLYLPPVAALVLSRAGSPLRLADEILALREEFTGTRAKFAAYEAALRSETITLKESDSIFRSIQEGLESINSVADGFTAHKALEWKNMVQLVNVELQRITKSNVVSIVGLLLGKPAEALLGAIRRRSVMYLSTLSFKARSLPPYQILVRNGTGWDITPEDVELAQRYGSTAVRRLVIDLKQSA